MGMNDKQFNSYVRFLLDAILDIQKETDNEIKEAKLSKIIDNLQKTLED